MRRGYRERWRLVRCLCPGITLGRDAQRGREVHMSGCVSWSRSGEMCGSRGTPPSRVARAGAPCFDPMGSYACCCVRVSHRFKKCYRVRRSHMSVTGDVSASALRRPGLTPGHRLTLLTALAPALLGPGYCVRAVTRARNAASTRTGRWAPLAPRGTVRLGLASRRARVGSPQVSRP